MIGDVIVCFDGDKVAINNACVIDIVCGDGSSVFGDEVAIIVKIASQLHVDISC
ncbi:Uncharacterised protein [Moraxella bovis]|uniref:Uncharacterized protein n=1 Tax=Moraxella bovis TaxID=476 RepID=A0A378PNA8_MORBO|nr:Uncharacterised protein [Moraxella bovis]